MDETLRQRVRESAGRTCEYCRLHEDFDAFPFQIDHIIAQKHHGPTIEANLAWSCFRCNVSKASNIAGLDTETAALTRLFDPRKDDWHVHFVWNGPELVGLTPIGRTTIDVLNINLPERIAHRHLLIQAGAFHQS